ncbi:MAG: response regulator transcription factor [Sulfurimonas sp.]|nr:response regulator transcription factor [Sulfurimonas sp.]
MKQTILIVDDEEDLLDLIDYTLKNAGYDTITCVHTNNIRAILDEEDISLILMDRNLPGVEGSQFIQLIRKEGYNHPVIYISAKSESSDIVEGFERGGDDYITKPFNINEFKARVSAMLRRTSKTQDVIKYKDIIYNATSKSFSIEGKTIKLTQLESDLLLEFIKNPKILLSRDVLLERVWGNTANRQAKTVNVAIKRLKKNIDPQSNKNYIQAIRGEGYIFC